MSGVDNPLVGSLGLSNVTGLAEFPSKTRVPICAVFDYWLNSALVMASIAISGYERAANPNVGACVRSCLRDDFAPRSNRDRQARCLEEGVIWLVAIDDSRHLGQWRELGCCRNRIILTASDRRYEFS